MVMVCMCVLTNGDGVCSLMVMVRMFVLTDGERVETGCGTENDSMDCTLYLWWFIKFITHILPNKVVAKLLRVARIL